MPANVIQADYDQLAKLMEQFSKEADQTVQLFNTLKRHMDNLQRQGWIGTGANAFYGEMEEIVFPGVNRLSNALTDASSATKRIVDAFRKAEEEGAALFSGEGASADGSGGRSSGGEGLGTGSGDSNGGTRSGQGNSYPDPAWRVNLNDRGAVDRIINPNIQGQDTPALARVMSTLNSNPTGAALDDALKELAEIRGVPEERIRADYDRFQQLKQQALNSPYGREHGGIDQLSSGNSFTDFFRQGHDHWGTTDQLRFGQIVGDTFGIDPVFGSLLSPTGGLVGPGDSALHFGLGNNQAVVVHGAVHDAGGFLHNYFNVGPGYHYVPGVTQILDTSNPLAGQVDGIQFWREQLAQRGQ
ncbi:MAG: hypothetical protein OHK0023_21190 [Anaerolineae bacterium]